MNALLDRQRQPEWMDDPHLDPDAHRRALADLSRLNRLAGSAGMLWRELRPLLRHQGGDRPLQVLDVACGGGDVTLALWGRAQRAGHQLRIAACDSSEVALDAARARADRAGADVEWFSCDVTRDAWPGGFDVVVSSLFLHHLEPAEAMALMRSAAGAGDRLRLLDLARSRRGWILARASTRMLSRSPVVRVDGPRSVEGAFTRSEVRAMAAAAGLESASVRPCWPARLMLRWDCPG